MNPTRKSTKAQGSKTSTIPKTLSLILDLHEKKLFSLISWLVIIFGGLIVTFHFLYASYLPDFNLTSSLGLLIIIAITGLTIVIYLSLSLTGPLIIWQMFLDIDEKHNAELWKHPYKTSHLFALPTLFSFLLLIGIAWYTIGNNSKLHSAFIALTWFLSPTLLGLPLYIYIHKRLKYSWLGWHTAGYLIVLIISNLLYILTPVTTYIFYFSRYAIDNINQGNQVKGLFLIIATSIICLIYNWVIFDQLIQNKVKKNQWVPKQMGFGLLLLIIILFTSQSWFSIPQAVLRMYSLADVENVTVVFDKKACSVIKQFGVKYIFDEKDGTCSINHATIVSDIGNDRLIESEEKKRFVITKGSANIVKSPSSNMNTTIIQSVDSNGRLQNIRIEFKDIKSEMNGISVNIALIDNQGRLLKRELIGQNITVSPNSGSLSYLLPASLFAEDGIWCDIDINKDGNSVSSQLTRITAFN